MSQFREILRLSEERRLYTEMIAERKTVSSKKAFITRSIKLEQQQVDEIKQCLRDNHTGWHLGDRISIAHVDAGERVIAMLTELRNTL